MRAIDFQSCPKTKAKKCECSKLESITESEETIKAICQLEHSDKNVSGFVKFKQTFGNETIIKGIIKGLTPGLHGFHIHEFGDLSDGCASAGGHYNPEGVDHGGLEHGHVGDLGNVKADDQGIARFQFKAPRVQLHDVVGRAIVVHADTDDLGQGGDEESTKTGNAGDRVACGVIRLKSSIEEDYNRKLSDKHFNRNELPQIRRQHIQDSDFKYKEGKISLEKIKPVQSQRVDGLSKKAEDVFLKNADRPFIIDRKGYLINGHHRFDAANVLGIKRVPAIIIDADIEDVMKTFAHTTSDSKTMAENYFKNLLRSKMAEDVIPMNKADPGAGPVGIKPFFADDVAQKAYDEWVNQAQVDQEDGVIVKATDGKQYRIMTSYGNQHFEDGEVYLDGVTDPDYIDTDGYPDAAELLYYHSATGHYVEEDLKNVARAGLATAALGMGVAGMDSITPDDFAPDKPQAVKSVDNDIDRNLAEFEKSSKEFNDLYNKYVQKFTDEAKNSFDRNHIKDKAELQTIKHWLKMFNSRADFTDYLNKTYPDRVKAQQDTNINNTMPNSMPDRVGENFADGKVKGKSRPGRVKKSGASCSGSVTSLRKKAKNSSGEKSKMYHWCANMKSGKKKS